VLARVGVRRDAWDAIISSGDLTRAYLAERRLRRIHHLGPPRDLPLFKGLDVERVALSAASAIVCTGVVDDANETGESYRPLLAEARERDLPLVCGNPDLVVDVGGVLLPCAGAVAAVYEAMGGDVFWAGKPHAPAYEGALHLAEAALGKSVDRRRILAIGDAVRTDLAGAGAYGIDCLLVAQGIHRQELMPSGRLDRAKLDLLLSSSEHRPVAAMTALAW
jgi:HAD superfamily hydrolase (TIGR01459 family)